MNVITRPTMTLDEFLAWEREQEGWQEFDGEQVIPMNGATRGHNRLTQRLTLLLAAQIDHCRFEVVTAGVKLLMGAVVRYPDLMVAPLPGEGDTDLVTDPAVVVEVISPSSIRQDTVVKAREYRACPSVWHYLVLRQDAVAATCWTRDENGWTETALTGDDDLGLSAGVPRSRSGRSTGAKPDHSTPPYAGSKYRTTLVIAQQLTK